MAETAIETETTERGEPDTPIVGPPIFVWPPRPVAVAKFLFGYPGYFVPMNILYMILAVVTWFWLTPDLATMQTFQWDWVALIYGRNLALAFLVFGGLHAQCLLRSSRAGLVLSGLGQRLREGRLQSTA